MAYPQTPEKILSFLPNIFGDPEVAQDLDRTGTRRDVVQSFLVSREKEVWRAIASNIGEADAAELELNAAKADVDKLQLKPSVLHKVLPTVMSIFLAFSSLVVLANIIFAIGRWRGWTLFLAYPAPPLSFRGAWLGVIVASFALVGAVAGLDRFVRYRFSRLSKEHNDSLMQQFNAALLGHSKLNMVTRYAHPQEEHQAAAMRRMEVFMAAKEIAEAEKKAAAVATIPDTLPKILPIFLWKRTEGKSNPIN